MDRPVALVTGASSGIGASTVLHLLRAGFDVHATARRVERMDNLIGAGARVLRSDLTDDVSVTECVDRVLAESGRVDLLVNNAGYGSYGALEDVPVTEARRQLEVNLVAPARLTQLLLPGMRARRSGRIVNVSSIGGKFYEPLGSWYHATKFALEGLSDSLRVELAPFGIAVVLVEPGPVLTEWSTTARENLIARSAGTAYAAQARSVARVMAAADRPGRAADPALVARTIVRAATTPRPRARYAVGRGAGTILMARRLLPDRVFDAAVSRAYLPAPSRGGQRF
jgi:NAD(P)-dependent dehydrogenase (short-subunit alcohol dehydrogenase family)